MSAEERVARAVAGIKAGREEARQTTGYQVAGCGGSTWFPSLRGAYAVARKVNGANPAGGIYVVEVATGKVVWGAAPDGHISGIEPTGTSGPAAE